MTEVEKLCLLKENRALFFGLLEENNAVQFEDLLNEHPDYIHMHCIADEGVSVWLILLCLSRVEFGFDYCLNYRIMMNWHYFI